MPKVSQAGGARRSRDSDCDSGDDARGARGSKAARSSSPETGTHDFEELPELITMNKCRTLAKKGHPEAQWRLATMYYYGASGLKPNLDLSLTWYKLACAGGLPKAMHDMACFFADGVPGKIPRDPAAAVDLWRKAATAGHVEAMTALGGAYDEGTGTEVDRTIAFEWFKNASALGDASAAYMLAWYYDVGFAPGGQSVKKANAAYQVAANRGDPLAMYQLGRNILHGRGMPHGKPDDQRALALFQQSADAKCGIGAFQLGWMLRNGRGCTVDEPQAVKWFKVSAEQDCADGLVALSQCFVAGTGGLPVDLPAAEQLARRALRQASPAAHEGSTDPSDSGSGSGSASPPEAVSHLSGGGAGGDLAPFAQCLGRAGDAHVLPEDQRHEATAEAAFALGVCLEAKHAPYDVSTLKEALLCYLLAARHGHADGMHNVGAMLDVGQVAQQNHKAAAEWYKLAAQRGDPSSMYALGLAYRAGRGVVASDADAIRWYRRAAEKGHARAWNKLGWMLEQGHGCKRDESGAIEAYREAAMLGSGKAMCHMAALHRDGRLGLPPNVPEAKRWFAAAARCGSLLAREQLLALGVHDWRQVQKQELARAAEPDADSSSDSPAAASSTGEHAAGAPRTRRPRRR